MTVGILTFHEGLNHGSFFQALALRDCVKSLGFDVDIINYKNSQHRANERRAYFYTKNPKTALESVIKYKNFKDAQSIMHLTKLTSDYKKIKHYDKIIVGSDTVWNFKDKFLGSDHLYFGHGLKCNELISYAPSFGNIEIDDHIPEYVASGLKHFSKISVRDKISQYIIRTALGIEVPIVLDPTVLFPVNSYEKEVNYSKYILVYSYMMNISQIDKIVGFAKQKNIPIISVGYENKWADINKPGIGPFEWLGYFKNASYIFTSTFHGSIFSILYNKKFFVATNSYIKNKTLSVLYDLGIEGREIDLVNKYDDFDTYIDYSHVNKIIYAKKNESLSYLRESLGVI